MIGHIVRKDLRLLWPLVVALAACHGVIGLLIVQGGNLPHQSGIASAATGLLSFAFVVGAFVLMAALVHQEPLTGHDADWLTRPIRRGDLLCAKFVFTLLFFIAPVLIISLAMTMANGFSIAHALGPVASRAASEWFLFCLPILAVAAVSRSLAQMLAMMAVVVFSFLAMLVGWISLIRDPHTIGISVTGINWVKILAALVLDILGSSAALFIQYHYRKTWTARATLYVTFCISVLLPFSPDLPAVAIEHALSQDPSADANIRLALLPDLASAAAPSAPAPILAAGWNPLLGDPADPASDKNDVMLNLPIQFSGLPSDSIIRTEHSVVRLIDASGKSLFRGTAHDINLRVPAGHEGSIDTLQALAVPASLLHSDQQPLTIEIEEVLILLRPRPPQSIELDAPVAELAGIGRCEAERSQRYGAALEVQCIAAGRLPSCISISTGESQVPAEYVECGEVANPFNWEFGELKINRGSITMADPDPPAASAGLSAGAPKNVQNSAQSIKLVAYEPVDRFARHLSAHSIELENLKSPPLHQIPTAASQSTAP